MRLWRFLRPLGVVALLIGAFAYVMLSINGFGGGSVLSDGAGQWGEYRKEAVGERLPPPPTVTGGADLPVQRDGSDAEAVPEENGADWSRGGDPAGRTGGDDPARKTDRLILETSLGGPGSGQGTRTTARTATRREVLTHVVRSGETLAGLADGYGLKVETLVAANRIGNPDSIRVGQRLTILPTDGVLYEVKAGDTLWEIARRYRVDVQEIMEYNQVADPAVLTVGQQLVLPGARPAATAVAASAPGVRAAGSLAFIWPLRGRISSYFGPRWGRMHTGVDIAAPYSTPIRASRAGEVTSTGWMGGYGRAVVVRHDDGTVTLYGHTSRVAVNRGDRVQQGDIIAYVGSTGNSTGPHLHFEIIVNDRPQDPMRYLGR